MNSSIIWHPILNYFLTDFKEKHPKASGFSVGNMDDFVCDRVLNRPVSIPFVS